MLAGGVPVATRRAGGPSVPTHLGRRLFPLTLRTGGTDGIRLRGVQFPGHNKGSVLPETSHPSAGARRFRAGTFACFGDGHPSRQPPGAGEEPGPGSVSLQRGDTPHLCPLNSSCSCSQAAGPAVGGAAGGAESRERGRRRGRGTCPSSCPPHAHRSPLPSPRPRPAPPPAPFRSTDKRET